MSDTPETDAIAHLGLCADSYIAQMTDKARSLERERNAARAETLEQATIVGKGAEREMALLSKLEWTRFELLKVQSALRKAAAHE
jgi:predicted RNA-binding protein with PIN domain